MAYKVPVLEFYEWQKAVKDKDLSAPPLDPLKGDRYIINYNPSGAWHNRPKRIAEWNGAGWDIVEPKEGMLTLVQDEGILYQYINDKWKDFALLVGKRRVIVQNDSYQLTLDDVGKAFTCDTTSICTYTLPSVGSADIGVHFTFIRTNSAGSLVIKAADFDRIAESSPGGTLFSDFNDQNYTTITLMLVAYNQWVITGGHGSWTVT
jgi:hypothetical protein